MSDAAPRAVTAPLDVPAAPAHRGPPGMTDAVHMETPAGAGAAPPLSPTSPPVATVPLVTHAPATAPATAPHRRETQMSAASAVPSTLESPKAPLPSDPLLIRADAGTPSAEPVASTLDEMGGTTLPDDAARDAAVRDAARRADATHAAGRVGGRQDPARLHAPPTLMSPIAGASATSDAVMGGRAGGTPALPLSEAVVVVDGPLAFPSPGGSAAGAFAVADGAPPAYGGATGGPPGWGAPGPHAPPFDGFDPRNPGGLANHETRAPGGRAVGGHPNRAPLAHDAREVARRSNTTVLVLLAVGVVVLLGAIAVAGGSLALVASRRAQAARKAASDGRNLPGSPPQPAAPAPPPTTPPAPTGAAAAPGATQRAQPHAADTTEPPHPPARGPAAAKTR